MLNLNDVIDLMMAIPVALAAKWAVWFAFGLALSIWGRREKLYLSTASEHDENPYLLTAYEHDEAPAKPKSGVRRHASVAAAAAAPSSGDAFADLAALFEPQEGTHRTPGEAPAQPGVPSASPVLAEAPRLVAPQSLP